MFHSNRRRLMCHNCSDLDILKRLLKLDLPFFSRSFFLLSWTSSPTDSSVSRPFVFFSFVLFLLLSNSQMWSDVKDDLLKRLAKKVMKGKAVLFHSSNQIETNRCKMWELCASNFQRPAVPSLSGRVGADQFQSSCSEPEKRDWGKIWVQTWGGSRESAGGKREAVKKWGDGGVRSR